jgi:hypothetical protein
MPNQFSDSASCLDPKTAAIHGRRPFGVSERWRLLRDCESQRRRQARFPDDLLPTGRSQSLTFSTLRLQSASGHPEGGRHGCRPFSDQATDGLSENGDDNPHPLSEVELTRKVLSLVTFFAPAKKVTRR